MIYNYTSLDTVIEKINRIQLFRDNYNPEELEEWAIEALLKIGVKDTKKYTSKQLEVYSGKTKLPTGMESLEGLLEGESGYPMEELGPSDDFRALTYKIHTGYIFTSFDEGSVIINYYELLLNNNKVYIPEQQYFLSAVESYLKFKIGEKLFWMQKIVAGQFQMLERDWLFYCNSAKNKSKELTNDGLHNFKRKHLQMFPNINKRRQITVDDNHQYSQINRSVLKA